MAIKAGNFVTGSSNQQLKDKVVDVVPVKKEQPTQKIRTNVALKLFNKIAEAKRIAEEKAQKLASRNIPSLSDVVERAKQEAANAKLVKKITEPIIEEVKKESKPAYSMSLSMKDQIMKSSKYLQDLTTKET